MYTEVHGIRMHYRIDGRNGAPWVTFINGIANDTTLWDTQVPALAQGFRLLRFDARDHAGAGRCGAWRPVRLGPQRRPYLQYPEC